MISTLPKPTPASAATPGWAALPVSAIYAVSYRPMDFRESTAPGVRALEQPPPTEKGAETVKRGEKPGVPCTKSEVKDPFFGGAGRKVTLSESPGAGRSRRP
jgi:hypothetical protein